MDADKDEDCRATRVSAFVKPNMLEVDVSHEPEKLKSWSTWSTKLPAQKVRTRNQVECTKLYEALCTKTKSTMSTNIQ